MHPILYRETLSISDFKFKSKAGCFYIPAFFLFGNASFTSGHTEIKLSKFEKMIQA
jgi:hypothetical protein